MSTLVLVEHEGGEIRPATLSVVAAATAIGGDVDLLVAGSDAAGVAEKAAKIAGVNKVMLADNAAYTHELAENLSALVVKHADGYSHILFAATAAGKNVMPRVAALLDVSGISDIIEVTSKLLPRMGKQLQLKMLLLPQLWLMLMVHLVFGLCWQEGCLICQYFG